MEENKTIVSEAPKGADAPKAGAGKAEPMQKMGDFEDGGKAVTSPTDASSTDHAKKAKKDTSAPTKGASPAEPMQKLNAEDEKENDKVKKEAAHDDDADEKEDDKEKVAEMPKTKAGIIQAMYDAMGKKKKSDLAASYGKMMAAMNGDEDEKDMDEAKHSDEEDKEKKEKMEKRVKDIDVKEDVAALVSGDDTLSETFKDKAATIFEAAVKSKVKTEISRLEDEYSAELSEATETFKNDLTNKVDNYLNYVVEQWMSENELAIEKGIKGEIAEDFIGGLKQLFEDHTLIYQMKSMTYLKLKNKKLKS